MEMWVVGVALNYGQLFRLIADLHDISSKEHTSLRGRLQRFQKLKFPPGVNTGKGRPAAYDIGAVLQVLYAFELLQLGMTPDRIVRLLKNHGAHLADPARRAAMMLSQRFGSLGVASNLFILDPAALANGGAADDHDDSGLSFFAYDTALLGDGLLRNGLSDRRLSLINVSMLIEQAANHLENHASVPLADFVDAVVVWAEEWGTHLASNPQT